jgi:hypothetical protein
MTAFHGRWSGNQQVFWLDGLVGATFITQFSAPPGTRDLYASFTAAPDFGIHTIFLDGVAIGTIDLYANQVLVTGPVYLGRFNFGPGGTQFKVMVSGSNPRAISRHGFGLDYILVSQPGTTDLIDPSGVAEFLLESAEPNPFTTETVIRYWLPSRNQVSLEIFDVSGRRVSMLEHGERGAGAHAVNWNGGDDSGAALSPGVYICTLHAGPRTQHRLITLLR